MRKALACILRKYAKETLCMHSHRHTRAQSDTYIAPLPMPGKHSGGRLTKLLQHPVPNFVHLCLRVC